MPTISKTGTAVSAVKTAAAVMVLALFVSVAGFVTSAGPTPAAAQDTDCVTTTAIVLGVSVSVPICSSTTTTTLLSLRPPTGRVWCSATFGNYFWGSTPDNADDIAHHRLRVAIGVLVGVEYVPTGCGVRPVPPAAGCVIYQGGKWDQGDGKGFVTIPGLYPGVAPRRAPEPWRPPNCLTTDYTIVDDAVLEAVRHDVCAGLYPAPSYVEFYAETSQSNDPFTSTTSATVRLEGDVLDFECCPNRLQHNDGIPGSECHSHLPEPCQTDTEVTYDLIDGDSHTPHTVAPCPPTSTAVGATFDIVLDYPRRGHGVFATIGGALKPVTFTATADNFVCRAPSPCGDPAAGRTVPTSVSFDLDLDGLHGYLEGRDDQFEEFSETFDGYSNGVDRWGRLDYSRQIVAYFYRATYTGDGTSANPAQRVAINVTDLNGNADITGRYRYSVFETFEEWVDDPDHPDGGYLQSVTETRRYSAPMTARLVDVDGDLITADTDPYYNSVSGRVELRIAGFQPVFD